MQELERPSAPAKSPGADGPVREAGRSAGVGVGGDLVVDFLEVAAGRAGGDGGDGAVEDLGVVPAGCPGGRGGQGRGGDGAVGGVVAAVVGGDGVEGAGDGGAGGVVVGPGVLVVVAGVGGDGVPAQQRVAGQEVPGRGLGGNSHVRVLLLGGDQPGAAGQDGADLDGGTGTYAADVVQLAAAAQGDEVGNGGPGVAQVVAKGVVDAGGQLQAAQRAAGGDVVRELQVAGRH